ncbi:hypothetical protein KDU71_20220 [Carboxylicivirga sediminis]|uniref:Uncharacterized protein n=1 Tax=Carboxylicivirga sediminis TaxID=2006564 RepID=A0A941F7H9_9BACT|nr:hypothetical protein [Carboxylicivirga sediminis]MBR8537909.1 hypothetical protein [Carboxylicivirga sediminis]
MRKVSAHYYLKSDGTFGKSPVVELDVDGRIVGVREMGSQFKEEAGLEYFPGIIVPGFVASCSSTDPHVIACVKRVGLINGVLRWQEGNDIIALDDYQRAWSAIKEVLKEQRGMAPLGHYLLKHTFRAAQLLGNTEWGIIGEGAIPGLIVLQNIDLRNFSITEKSSFRIIQK